MDNAVIRSMLKWPDVPAAYGWLLLDRRGNWRIRAGSATSSATPSPGGVYPQFESHQFEPIGNAALKAFIARNYLADERGCWYFQNGPQRVFVALAYAPYVYRLEGGELCDHCGQGSGNVAAVWLDEEGCLVLAASSGLGILDDRDLGAFAEDLARGVFTLGGTRLEVGRLCSSDLEARFGFVREPRA